MKRHNARIFSVLTYFNIDINNFVITEMTKEEIDEVIKDVKSTILDNDYEVEIDYDFSYETIDYIRQNHSDITNLISSSLQKWSLSRLSYVDRALMICATAEMLLDKAPKAVIINEYLEITKEYSMVGDKKQVGFNNRVLDTIAKKVYGE